MAGGWEDSLKKGLSNGESSPLCITMEPDIVPLMETRLMRKATLQSEFDAAVQGLRRHSESLASGSRLITSHLITPGCRHGQEEGGDSCGRVGRGPAARRAASFELSELQSREKNVLYWGPLMSNAASRSFLEKKKKRKRLKVFGLCQCCCRERRWW